MRTACLLTLLCAGLLGADDDRSRRAKVALALAAKPAVVALAPAPHPAVKDYRSGYKSATIDQMPLVVFVNCDVQTVPGAIVARADSLGDVVGPAVVVGYPVSDRLFIDVTLPGKPDPARVKEAVKNAARKIDLPGAKDMPAPKPLSWDL